MTDIEVHIDLQGLARRVGTLRRTPRRGSEGVVFEYRPDWLGDPRRFSLKPALAVGPGAFTPAAGQSFFGSIGDSAPDTWGRRLMQRAERHRAALENRPPRALAEADYLLGLADVSRLGALRFREVGRDAFQALVAAGVPKLVDLGRLLAVTERIGRDEETDEDLQLIFAPGVVPGRRAAEGVGCRSARPAGHRQVLGGDGRLLYRALGGRGARPGARRGPAHVRLRPGRDRRPRRAALAALRPRRRSPPPLPFRPVDDGPQGRRAGLLPRAGRPPVAPRRRRAGRRRPALPAHGLQRARLQRRRPPAQPRLPMRAAGGWSLSPAYDLNSTPADVRPRILTTNIDVDEGTCDLALVLEVADFFGLSAAAARAAVGEVGRAVAGWSQTAERRGARAPEIRRMASAFEHVDLERALRL